MVLVQFNTNTTYLATVAMYAISMLTYKKHQLCFRSTYNFISHTYLQQSLLLCSTLLTSLGNDVIIDALNLDIDIYMYVHTVHWYV